MVLATTPTSPHHAGFLMNHRALSSLICLALLLPFTADARIKRSQSAKVEFKYKHPCPATGARKGPCKGWIIDHINPLACGGLDAPVNMQWQTIEDSKAKDKWERKGLWCKEERIK